MKCPGRVILRRHNGASSGSSRIISLGCVRAANNSLLFPVLGTVVNDDGRRGGAASPKHSLVHFAQFASCRVRLPWMRMHPHADAIARDFPRVREIGHVDLDSRSTREINRLRARSSNLLRGSRRGVQS